MSTDPLWRSLKLQELCDERHPILSRMRLGDALPNDEAILRHIRREIDYYQMQEARPAFAYGQNQMRKLRNLALRVKRMADKIAPPCGGKDVK